MINIAGVMLLMTALGQPFAGPPPVPGAPPPGGGSSVEVVEVIAARALSNGEPFMDAALQPVEQVLRKLPFKNFTLESQKEQEVPYGSPISFPVNDQYSTSVLLKGQGSQGEVVLEITVQLAQPQAVVKALSASGTAQRGKPLVFRGLELPDGELVVIVRIKQPDQQQQQQNQDQSQSQSESQQQQSKEQQQQQEKQDQQEKQQDEQQDKMAQNQDEQDPNAQNDSAKQDSEEQMQNIEAILQSLQEIDRKEQKQSQNRRSRVIVSGDWW